MEDTIDWVYELLSKRGTIPGKDRETRISADILDSGLIDSLGLVELISEVESAFQIRLTSEDMEDSRFQTIKGLADIIDQRVKEG